MNQSEHPHDPFARESEASAAPEFPAASTQPVGASAEPAPSAEPSTAPAAADPYAAAPQTPAPSADPYAAPAGGAPSGSAPYGDAPQQPTQPVPPSSGAPMSFDQAPAHIKGVYPGPLPGQPASDSDAKLWSMFAQLSTIVGYVIGAGFLGWLGPLIIFLVYKDRNRFIRFNAAEALNAAIAVFIAEIALSIVITIIAIVTFGIGSVLYVLVAVPAILHIVFAILGAVKANQGEWWNYPLNIRLVK
ncbi:DUF4870 domain-containing protein [Brachybacterium sp. J153]|uniref:DUF4870 domain-containing protein n=1 Tax=Brachybacterium sp. J153 TaxID=3116488 RepID=UPI002E78D8A0|nr:DUF4870 domain-containing protein [Brachybacterium sp. J153]MEE1617272.1 DUF4870 domain-containing protein [Brachybacterium sp. J153]